MKRPIETGPKLPVGVAILVLGIARVVAASSGSPPVPSGAGPGAGGVDAKGAPTTRSDSPFTRMPLYFIENRGQLDGRVGFYLQGRTAAYFTADGIMFSFTKPMPPPEDPRRPQPEKPITMPRLEPPGELPDPPTAPPTPEAKRWAVAMDLLGARQPLWPEADDQLPTIVSYFKGPKEQWKTALPTYQTVRYREIWPGVDLEYTVKPGQMKYTFVVQPGADPRAIKLRYRGAASAKLDEGELVVETPLGGIRDQKPVVYQDLDGCREDVRAEHTLRREGEDWVAGFKVSTYDRSRPLVIDPVVLAYEPRSHCPRSLAARAARP